MYMYNVQNVHSYLKILKNIFDLDIYKYLEYY